MIPRPQKATRPISLVAMSATSGGLDSQPVSGAERSRRLGRQLVPVQQVPTRPARLPAVRARGRVAAALRDERVAHLVERLQVTHHAVAAALAPRPAGATPERVLDRAQRE